MRTRSPAPGLRTLVGIVVLAVLAVMQGSATVLSQASNGSADPSAGASASPTPAPGTFSGEIDWSTTHEVGGFDGTRHSSASIVLQMAWDREPDHVFLVAVGGSYNYLETAGGDCPRSWSGSGAISTDPNLLFTSPGVGMVSAMPTFDDGEPVGLEFTISLGQDESHFPCAALGDAPGCDGCGGASLIPGCMRVLATDDAGPPVSYVLTCQEWPDDGPAGDDGRVTVLDGVMTQVPSVPEPSN